MKVNLRNVIPFKGKQTVNKVEFLRDRYTKEEIEKDKKDQGVNIPYFLRVETRINETVNANKVEVEYNKYTK